MAPERHGLRAAPASVEDAQWPHSLEAEAAVLSAVILSPSALDDVSDLLTPARFYSEAHRWIYESFLDLRETERAIDTVTVMNWLKEKQRIEIVGVGYFTEMLGATPVIANVREHAQIVHDMWRRREALRFCAMFRAEALVGRRDTQDLCSDIARVFVDLASSQVAKGFVSIGEVTQREFTRLSQAQQSGQAIMGLRTGFDRFDRMTGGLRDQEVTIVAGRPGMGKTSVLLGIAANVAMADARDFVAIFSLEMPQEQLAMRMLCSEAHVNTLSWQSGTLSAADWSKLTKATEFLHDKGIGIDDTPAIQIAQIRARLRQLRNELEAKGRRLRLVGIDYMQLMGTLRLGNREQEIGDVSRSLKTLAKEFGIPLIVLSQLNRAPESRAVKHPQLSDLRESGSIEQDADNVVFIHRDAYYKKKGADPNIAEWIIAKQRNGPPATVKVHWEGYCANFSNLAEGEYDDYDPDERTGAR